MNTQPLKPASSGEISDAIRVLFDAGLPFQRGVKPDGVALAYVEALHGHPIEAIHAGIRKFLRGECEEVNPKFVPTPPELARIVRKAVMVDRIPEERRLSYDGPRDDGERLRMRLKVPMWQFAHHTGRYEELARADRDGFGAMVVLAANWGVKVPQGLLDMPTERAEREWREGRNRAIREVERNPPPFMRQHHSSEAA